MERIYLVPAEALPTIEKILKARQARLGEELLTWTSRELPLDADGGCAVELILQVPVAWGAYSFLATLDHAQSEDGMFQNLVRALPGALMAIPEDYRVAEPQCVVCGSRRRRARTFLAWHPTDGFVQVGTSCLNDLTQSEQAEAVLSFAAEIDTIVEQARVKAEQVRAERVVNDPVPQLRCTETLPYLTQVVAAIRLYGWRSKQAETGQPTCYAAQDLDVSLVTAADRAEAERVRVWALAMEPANDLDYEAQRCVREAQFDLRRVGLVAALVRRCPPAVPPPISQPVGTPKSRVQVRVTAKRVRENFAMQWSSGAWHLLVDADGNVFIWTSSKDILVEGQQYELVGTIREHRPERHGPGMQTVLTRCTVLTMIEAAQSEGATA